MEQLSQFIDDTGFPISMALLLYLDLRRVIGRNTKVVDSLDHSVNKLAQIINAKWN